MEERDPAHTDVDRIREHLRKLAPAYARSINGLIIRRLLERLDAQAQAQGGDGGPPAEGRRR